MLLLISGGTATARRYDSPHIGALLTPHSRTTAIQHMRAIGRRVPWAMDNACFTGLDARAYRRMLMHNAHYPGCLWVVVPDVVADAAATLALWRTWLPVVRSFGYPPAFVLQDGQARQTVPWADMRCLFIGGTTAYKLSATAHGYVQEAKRRGLWVHMGRVNSQRRLALAAAWGCDSVDGTGFSRFSNTTLPWALAICANPWLAPPMNGDAA